jgi:flavorubredoxin
MVAPSTDPHDEHMNTNLHDVARHLPLEIAPDTFVIQATQGEGVSPLAVHLNAMVIRGPEPIIVDTGVPGLRERYLADMFSLVDPEDVRWVFLSHDDVDHYGNLDAVMAACPNATLLTSWFQWERLENMPSIPPFRMRWLDAGESFEANGRTYVAIRPPVFDSPTTRGLFDTATGVYWASDCFATPVARGTGNVEQLAAEEWREGFMMFQLLNSPWVTMIDDAKFQRAVDDLAGIGITAIASAHGPAITGANVGRAMSMLRELPGAQVPPTPGQAVLDEIVASILAGAPS